MTKPNKQIHTWLVPAAGYKHSGQLPESLGRSQRRDKGPQIRASPFASSDGRPTLGIKTFNTIWPHFSTQTDNSNWVCVHLQSTAPRTLEGLTFSRDQWCSKMIEFLRTRKASWIVNEKTIYIPAGHECCSNGRALEEEIKYPPAR